MHAVSVFALAQAASGGPASAPWSLASCQDKLTMVADLHKAFSSLDTNGDGQLTVSELAAAFTAAGVPAASAAARVRAARGV